MLESLNKVGGLKPSFLLKRDSSTAVFLSHEICEKTYFKGHLQTTASGQCNSQLSRDILGE